MTPLARALLDELGPDDLAELAQRLAPYLPTASAALAEWLDTKAAAEYLHVSVSTIQKLAARREIDPHAPKGGRARFRRAELDEWAVQR